jgi:hypothetical protein
MGFLDSFGGYGSIAVTYMTTTAFWILLMLVLIIGFFLILVVRKRRKFDKNVIELYDLGDGRFDFVFHKNGGGWFKAKFTLMGLWDYGSEIRFRLKDMTPVDNISHNDYRTINGKKGIILIRNPHDTKMVFPISQFYLSKNSKLMMSEVAPADYRESAVKSIEQVDQEMTSQWQKYAPLIITGVVIIIALIITLLNTQYGKYMVDKAVAMIAEIKSTPCQVIPTTTAP